MTPDKRAVIFDWNGVIPDDASLICEATNKILKLLGSNPIPVEKYRDIYEVPIRNSYIALGCCENKMHEYRHEMVEVWRDHYEANVAEVPLRDGADAMLNAIKAMGHPSVVLSNYVHESISRQALKLGVHHYFDEILARDYEDLKSVMHSKNKGDRLHAYVAARGIQHGIVIGDSPEEMEIARDFGFASIGISGGCCSAERIRAARPDYMINALTEVPEIVRRVFSSGRGK